MTYPFAQNGRVVDAGPSLFGGGNDSFLDMAVPWSDLAALGLDADERRSPSGRRRRPTPTAWTATSPATTAAAAPSRGCRRPPAPIAPDPAGSPGPVGGPGGGADGGGGNVLGRSGIEGGPGCGCGVARSQRKRIGGIWLLFAVSWIATRRRWSQRR